MAIARCAGGAEWAGWGADVSNDSSGQCAWSSAVTDTHSACKMVSYHAVHKTCCGAESHAFDMNPVYAEDVDNSWLFIEVQAFRARAGTGLSVYSAWANSGHHDDAPVNTRLQLGCLSDPMSCQPIFRSVYLDTWTSAGVKKVSLRLYKKGAKVVDVVFDGTGSDAESWMTPSRILQSLWTNLPKSSGSYNYFSLEGYSSSRRRFHINAYYMGCSLDKGWLTVTDPLEGTRTPCDWEQHPPHPPYPAFIYSTASGPTTWQNNNAAVDVADVLAVFIQF
ncbi:uncharacterized protein LOC143284966 [Babylonia areolata]|uniref:uncharacterized protein LOC143284966 n=1 Tax=Babylonia areolata TaxID=304850 RepID=UPI003FD68FC8